MKYQSIRVNAVLSPLILLLFAAFPGTIRADNIVLAGFDLFITQPGTQVNLGPAGIVALRGVPLGTFNFGSGPVATFNTDTIVQRLGNATVASPSVPIQLVALQLMTENEINLGAGTGFYFVTLQSARGGPASLGMITINGLGAEPAPGLPHGTFDSFFDVFYDIRFGSLDGPIVFSGSDHIMSFGNFWGHFPEPGDLEIPGVNTFLNGVNRQNDFFPLTDQCTKVIMENGTTVIHNVCPAEIPEPATIFLLGPGLAGVAIKMRQRFKNRRRAQGNQ